MIVFSRFFLVIKSLLFAICCAATTFGEESPQLTTDSIQFFESRIRPVLVDHCYACHSTGSDQVESGLLLDTREATLRGGDSGPAVVPGNVEESLLVEAIRYDGLEMPPDGKLPDRVIADFVKWIEMGAPDPRDGKSISPTEEATVPSLEQGRKHWSFRRLARPPLPNEVLPSVYNAADTFVMSRLRDVGLSYSPAAPSRTLARRVHFDLIGLPPDPRVVRAFESDESPQAYSRLLDRLLASPHFGERWGRHWLDVVGYVDAIGFEVNAAGVLRSEDKWRYRDYVIGAYNQDKPFDRFVMEQIAGDELVDWRSADRYSQEIRDCLIATGYLRTAQDFTHEPESNIPMNYFEVLQDTIEIFGKSMLALSLDCVQCHSHKFDPIPHKDYYRLMATLAPAYNPNKDVWRTVIPFNDKVRDRSLPLAGPAEIEEIKQHNETIDQEVKRQQAQIVAIRGECEARLREAKADELAAAQASSTPEPVPPPLTDGLSLWLAADQQVYVDDAGTVSATIGQVIYLWKDRLAGDNEFANDLIQTDPSRRPVLVDGVGTRNQRALRFDKSTGCFLKTADHSSLRPATGLSIFAVYQLTNLESSDMELVTKYDEGNPSGGNWGVDLYQSPKRPRFYAGRLDGNGFGGDAVPKQRFHDTKIHQLSVIYDSGTVTIRMDQAGQQIEHNIKGPPPSPSLNNTHEAELLVGARATYGIGVPANASAFLSADVAEILIYESALSETEAGQVEDYLLQKYGQFGVGVSVSDEEITAALTTLEQQRIANLESEIAALHRSKRNVGKIQALWDVGPPPKTFVNLRGNFERPGPEVQPGYLRVLLDSAAEPLIQDAAAGSPSSGRRTALARWLTDVDSTAAALVSRVKVNRIWQHLFGQGLVTTPDNFGLAGQAPTHPELLEWLAADFVHHGWSVKRTVRQLMLSAAYQQTSELPASHNQADTPQSVDPGNQLLWRMRLRRLESEIIRDSVLSTSGRLDTSLGGRPVEIDARNDGTVVISGSLPTPAAKWRRSIYLFMRRSYHLNLMSVFDQPVMATNYSQRDTSAVPLQSLTMMNDPVMVEQSKAFAERVARRAGPSAEDQIEEAYQLALSRSADQDEHAWCRQLLNEQALVYQSSGESAELARFRSLVDLCLALFNTSEFLYAH